MQKSERLLTACLLLIFSFLWANLSLGYDNFGNSAKATGMGNAFVGVADDPSAIFYNPAGLAKLKTWHISFLYDKKTEYGLPDDENPFLASGVVVFPIRKNISVGISGCQRGSWSDPTQVVTNNLGQLSLSAQVNEQIFLGFSGKYLFNSNFGKKKGADFDFGILYHPIKSFSLGFAGENLLATDMRPEVSEFRLASDKSVLFGYSTRQAKAGMCYTYDATSFLTNIAFDLVVKNVRQPMQKTYTQESFGVEQWIYNQKKTSFALRCGYTLGKDYEWDYKQPTFGWGMRYKGKEFVFQVDYSWQKYPYHTTEKLAGDHRLSFTFSPSWVQKTVKRESEFARKEKPKVQTPQESISKPRTSVSPDLKELTFELYSQVENVSFGEEKSVVFLLRPQVDFDALEWKLYICNAQPPGWSEEEIKPYLVKVIKGNGMPGFGVMWKYRAKETEGGNYFYSLILMDRKSQRWHSTWRSFEVKY